MKRMFRSSGFCIVVGMLVMCGVVSTLPVYGQSQKGVE